MEILIVAIIVSLVVSAAAFVMYKRNQPTDKKVAKPVDPCANGVCDPPSEPVASNGSPKRTIPGVEGDAGCVDCKPVEPCTDCCTITKFTLTPTNVKGYDPSKFCGATLSIKAETDCPNAKFEWFVERVKQGKTIPAVKYGNDDSIFYHRQPTDNAIVNEWDIGDYVICIASVKGVTKELSVKIL